MLTDLKQHRVAASLTISEAIGRLDQVQPKLLLVTSAQGVLLGTVTDGDIRRALLKHLSLDAPLEQVMNPAPKTLQRGGSEAAAERLMQQYGLTGIPRLDEAGRVLDILGPAGAIPSRENAVFLMAGGFGKRLRPLTDNCPKPMLKVGDKPILETILEQFIRSGFKYFYISTCYLNEQIENYFGDGSRFGVSISYVREDSPLGTAGAIGLLPESAKQLPLLMMNGDLLTQVDFNMLLDFHIKEDADLSVAVREYQMQVPYGVVQHRHSSITEIVEKPVENYFINAGIYCISPQAAQSLTGMQAVDMPDLISTRLKAGRKVSMFPIHEYWLDIGRMSDFHQAQSDILRFSGAA